MAVMEQFEALPAPGFYENGAAPAAHQGDFYVQNNQSFFIIYHGGRAQNFARESYCESTGPSPVTVADSGVMKFDLYVNLRLTVGDENAAATTGNQINVRTAEFLAAVYDLDANEKHRHAMRRVIDYIDDLLNAGRFDDCDAVFRQADAGKLSPSVITSFLGITLAARNRLRFRRGFYNNALAAVEKALGESAAVDLLQRFR
jgi:hypothetical protein